MEINKYLYFDLESGKFSLTDVAANIIYNQKHVICSYSGADEWCNHFVCELLDLYGGSSVYNHAFGNFKHEEEIPRILNQNKDTILAWLDKNMRSREGKTAFSMFEKIIDDLPVCA